MPSGFWIDDRRRLSELLTCLQLTLGVDDLRPLLALGLGLTGHGPLHGLRQLDVLHFDDADLDTPRLGLLVDDLLQLFVDLFPFQSRSSSVDWPSTERGVVWAICDVARL